MKTINVIFRKSLFSALLLISVFSFAQKPFMITGYGKGLKDGDKIYLLYREPGKEKSAFDSVTVRGGAFAFKGTITNVVTGGLYRNTNPMRENFIQDAVQFYVEPGNIGVKSTDTLRNSVLSGTQLNADYNELRQLLWPLMVERSKLKDVDELTEAEKKDQKLVSTLTKQWEDIAARTTPISFNFIQKHPNSYVSLVTLGDLSANKKLLPQVENIFPVLAESLKTQPLGKKILERIAFEKKTIIGMQAKDFAQTAVNGKLVKLSDYKGKYVLVDFWASWCLPCREENPNVLVAYKKYKKDGFEVLGVSIDDIKGRDAWMKAIKDDGLTWTQVSDLKGWKNEVAILYGITSVPSNVLIDPNGKIIAKDIKGIALTAQLERLFEGKNR